MQLVLSIFLAIVGLYLLFLALSPLVIPLIQLLSPGPADKNASVSKGQMLIKNSRTVVVVGAHPDDVEWYAGGTLAALSEKDAKIIIVMATDGGNLRKLRRAEQLKAARIIGYDQVVFLDYPDGFLKDQPRDEVTGRIEKVLQQYKPDTLITFDPFIQGPVYHHPDHVAAGKAAVSAAKQTGVKSVYLFHSGAPDTWVDISKGIQLKADARAAHKTQTKWFLTPFGMDYIIKEAAWFEGRKAGLHYAESFRRL